jgi:hypothetical protein
VDELPPLGSDPAVQGRLAAVARRTAFETGDTSVAEAEVYGPASHLMIEQALDLGGEREEQVPDSFYLVVLHGEFVNPRSFGPRERLRHRATAAQVWSPEWGYQYGVFCLADRLPGTPAQLGDPLVLGLDYHQPVGPLVDHGPRYQLLDHAADALPLWECRHGIVVDPPEGEAYTLHRQRTPDDLRSELERLIEAGLVNLVLWTDASRRPLRLDEARKPLADDRNWRAPYDLGEDERRRLAYVLALTDSGREEVRQEHARTQAIDGRLGQRTDLHLLDGQGMLHLLRRLPVRSS